MTFAKSMARERPDEIALRDENKALTWADADDILNRVTNGLLNLDLGSDRRIAVIRRFAR